VSCITDAGISRRAELFNEGWKVWFVADNAHRAGKRRDDYILISCWA